MPKSRYNGTPHGDKKLAWSDLGIGWKEVILQLLLRGEYLGGVNGVYGEQALNQDL